MIRTVLGLKGVGDGENIVNYRFTRFMQAAIDPSQDSGAIDSSQTWFLECIDDGTNWRVFYTGANTQSLVYAPDGNTYFNNDSTFMAIKVKSNDVTTGWNKVLDVNGDPKPIFKPSFVPGRFDYWQVWIRTIISDGGGNLRAWFIGDDGASTYDYRLGYATSTDWGDTWTKLGTTPIYTDFLSDGGSRGIVSFKLVWNGTHHVMIYGGVAPNVDGLKVVQSVDGITSWSVVTSGLFAGTEIAFPMDFKYVDGVYYLWLTRQNRIPGGNLGPCAELYVLSSTNLTTWTERGTQLIIRGAQEFGLGNHSKVMQKPNGQWFMLHTYYINRTQAYDALNNTKEPSPATKVADSNNDQSFIMNSACTFQYPDYVTFHAPLGIEDKFTEYINNITGVLNTGSPGWTERDHLKLTAGQKVTFPNNGSIINGSNFGIKMRIQTLTSGTPELFKIGNDILINLSSGKLRVRLSSNGAGYEKDYITTINIAKPAGLDYIDDHIYIAILWDGSTLRMWNADCVEEFTAGQITKTVDNALTTVNNSMSDIVLCDNSSIEFRSVSILDAPTATELQQLNI